MAMEFLACHDQLVADFAAYQEQDYFAFINIIQDAQVTHPQFEVREKIWAQALDGFGHLGGLVLQPRLDSRLKDSLISDRQ
jgi:hypothetical protein